MGRIIAQSNCNKTSRCRTIQKCEKRKLEPALLHSWALVTANPPHITKPVRNPDSWIHVLQRKIYRQTKKQLIWHCVNCDQAHTFTMSRTSILTKLYIQIALSTEQVQVKNHSIDTMLCWRLIFFSGFCLWRIQCRIKCKQDALLRIVQNKPSTLFCTSKTHHRL